MPQNMSALDRILRTLVAIVLVILNLTGVLTGAVAVIAWVVAVIFVATALTGFCPLYALFKISTRRAGA